MSDLREALRKLHASAKEARRLGAVTGSHWTWLDVACLKAEAALAEPAHTDHGRHWHRTCPACNASIDYGPAEPAQELADGWANDACAWGDALNDAGWTFIEACPEKSTLLFNTVKPALRAAILKYAERVAADRASRLPEMGEGDWPDLPASQVNVDVWDSEVRGLHQANAAYYTADQLRAYGVAAVEAYKALVRGKT